MVASILHIMDSQRDVIIFFQLVPCFICALETLVLAREDGKERRWSSSLSFFVWQGIAALWLLAAFVVTLPADGLIEALLQAVSFCPLFAYAAPAGATVRRINRLRFLALPLFAGAVTMGFLLGPQAGALAASLLLGVPGITFTIRFLRQDEGIQNARRPFLFASMISLGVFGALTLLVAALPFMMTAFPVSIPSATSAVALFALSLTLSLHAWRSFRRLNRNFGRPLTRAAISVAFVSLPAIIVLGCILTVALGDRTRYGLFSGYATESDLVGASLEASIGEIDREVSILADIPGMDSLLAKSDADSRSVAKDILVHFSRQVESSCAILNTEGGIVAASGAGLAHSEFGHDRWFIDALAGEHGRFLALDPVKGNATYYGTAPVWNLEKGIVGVALMAGSVDSLFPPLVPNRVAMIIDQFGTILYATAPHLIRRALWPPSASVETHEDAGPDTRPGTGASFFPARYAPGTIVPGENGRLLLARSFLSVEGVSLVYLGPIEQALVARVGVLLATLVVLMIVLSFAAAGQVSLLDEARVERSESQYRALVENSPDWVSIVDSNGVFLFTNTSGRMHLGIGESAAAAIPVESLLGKEHVEEIAACVRRTSTEGSVALETRLPSVSGHVKVWQITFVPLHGSEPTHAAMLIGIDITDIRGAEARLIRAERMAALGTLAAGVAHQFNNINQIALWSLQILEADPALPSSATSSLRTLRRALDRSVEITTRMLPLSIPPVEGVWPHIGEMIRDRITSLQGAIERGNVEVRLDLRDSHPVSVGREQLDFIVNALLSNALDALVERPIRLLSVETADVDSMTRVRVTDTGIGIAAEKLSSLFTPFFSEKGENAVPNSPLARVHGVGLSLSVSQSIVGAAGGRIDAESTLGVGSTFTLWLPNAPERPGTES